MFLSATATFTVEPHDIIHQFGDPVSALLYSTLFHPELIEVDDSVLLLNNIHQAADRFRAARRSGQLSLAALEASFNTIEVA